MHGCQCTRPYRQQHDASELQGEHGPGECFLRLQRLTQQSDGLQTQGEGKQIGEIAKQLEKKIGNPCANVTNGIVDFAARSGGCEARVGRRVADQSDEQKQPGQKTQDEGAFAHDALRHRTKLLFFIDFLV